MTKLIGFFVGLFFLIICIFTNPPSGLEAKGFISLGITLMMATWWMTEPIPIPVTSLLPIILFPSLGILDIKETVKPYSDPVIYLYLGGFFIAIALEKWNLHKRFALNVLLIFGTNTKNIIASFLFCSAIISMWTSNSSTTLMMLPVGLSVIELVSKKDQFPIALLLAIAYGAGIGGMGTLVGTPPNALASAFLKETFQISIGFSQWMILSLPIVFCALIAAYFVLTRIAFQIEDSKIENGDEYLHNEKIKLGNWSKSEIIVGIIFFLTIFLWISQPILSKYISFISDTTIAIFSTILLFTIPLNWKKNEYILIWEDSKSLPWDVLILFGGGLSMASAIEKTKLSNWIGESLIQFTGDSVYSIIFLLVLLTIVLTQLTSNLATTSAFLPVAASFAKNLNQNPLIFIIPMTLAASCAFMFPVSTPPNAIVYGTKKIPIKIMARAGAYLNSIFIIILFGFIFLFFFLNLDFKI